MASTSGLTRRRGGAGAAVDDEDGSRVGSPVPSKRPDDTRSGPETSYESSANGHKIAFDPRDISESAERSKQPKLTLMEEILLMGLKDKQVNTLQHLPCPFAVIEPPHLFVHQFRATSPFGTTTFPTLSVAALL